MATSDDTLKHIDSVLILIAKILFERMYWAYNSRKRAGKLSELDRELVHLENTRPK